MAFEVDVGVLAREPRQDPVLALAAVFALPQLADQIVGQVIEQLFAGLGEQGDVTFLDPGFFPQLAQGCGAQVFALVDPALRHLPVDSAFVRLTTRVDPAADKGQASGVDQHDADAWTVGKVGKRIAHAAHLVDCGGKGNPRPLTNYDKPMPVRPERSRGAAGSAPPRLRSGRTAWGVFSPNSSPTSTSSPP